MTKRIAGFNSLDLRPAKVPTFVQLVQPAFRWDEYQHNSYTGRVALPHRGRDAVLIAPQPDTEEANFIRLHELLHARYTPAVSKTLQRLVSQGASRAAINLGEDHRLKHLGLKHGAFDLVDAWCNGETAIAYFKRNASSRLGIGRLETATIVHCCIALDAAIYKDGFDPTDVRTLVDVLVGHGLDASAVDVEKAQQILDIFTDRCLAIRADYAETKYEHHRAVIRLVYLVENCLREARGRIGTGERHVVVDGSEAGEADEVVSVPSTPFGGGDDGKGDTKAPDGSEDPDEGKHDAAEVSPLAADAEAPDALLEMADIAGHRKRCADEAAFRQRRREREEVSRLGLDKPQHKPTGEVARSEYVAGTASACSDATGVPSGETLDELIDSAPLGRAPVAGRYLVKKENWGPLVVQYPPLTRPKKHLAPQRGAASVDGVLPRHFSRWFSDRAILDRRGRRPGGSLLIDVSGSMSWSHDLTLHLLDICPALTLAIYSSANGSADGRNSGVLSVLARNGKAISRDVDHWALGHGGGNVVDGPALAWLLRQSSPRVWFCDGAVTGIGDNSYPHLGLDAFRLAALGNVTRTVSLERVVATLAGFVRPKPVGARELKAAAADVGLARSSTWPDTLLSLCSKQNRADKALDRQARDDGASVVSRLRTR